MTEIAPKTALAAFTREQIADYDDWDTPHAFMTIHNVDGELKVGMYAMITPDMPPAAYPQVISGLATDFLKRLDDPADDLSVTDAGKLPPPCAYLLQIEAHMMKAKDAAQAEQIRSDNRRFSERPDSIEIANAVCVDVHGRIFSVTKRRDTGEIDEMFYAPGIDTGTGRLGGRFTDALLAVAHATGMSHWGLPGPIPLNN